MKVKVKKYKEMSPKNLKDNNHIRETNDYVQIQINDIRTIHDSSLFRSHVHLFHVITTKADIVTYLKRVV